MNEFYFVITEVEYISLIIFIWGSIKFTLFTSLKPFNSLFICQYICQMPRGGWCMLNPNQRDYIKDYVICRL